MSFLIADRVKETTTSTGTGSLTLAGAMIGFQSFAAGIGNGNQTFYTITDGIDWEVGSGTYFSSGTVLIRDSVIASSNSGSKVNWGAGEKQVFVTYPAAQAVYSFPNNIAITGAVSGSGALGSVDVPQSFDVEYLVVAGGGGGGSNVGGGGGAGGYRTGTFTSLLFNTNYTVTVGAGGAGGINPAVGTSGQNSVFNSITSNGGGGGGGASTNGVAGGSGGGAGGFSASRTGGAGNTPSTSPSQGNNGGTGTGNSTDAGYSGGGGGAGAVGGNGSTPAGGGNGGNGLQSSITGTEIYYAGGGGGGSFNPNIGGNGGLGGGGDGADGSNTNITAGTANTGGGGGGSGSSFQTGAAGGSGVVIIKYRDYSTISNPGGGLTFSTSTAVSGYKITTFTAGTGNIQFS